MLIDCLGEDVAEAVGDITGLRSPRADNELLLKF